jgi:hypothetical protein
MAATSPARKAMSARSPSEGRKEMRWTPKETDWSALIGREPLRLSDVRGHLCQEAVLECYGFEYSRKHVLAISLCQETPREVEVTMPK